MGVKVLTTKVESGLSDIENEMRTNASLLRDNGEIEHADQIEAALDWIEYQRRRCTKRRDLPKIMKELS